MDVTSQKELGFLESFEVKKFDEVCAELLTLEKVLQIKMSFVGTAEGTKDVNDTLVVIWSNLNQFLLNIKSESDRVLSKSDILNFNEFIFVMIGMIDEVFLRKDKIISDFWKNNLLEFIFFKTRSAGSLFFEKIDSILSMPNEKSKGLCYVYLKALSMGFKGQYSMPEKEENISHYKQSLYSFIFNKSPFSNNKENVNSLVNGGHVIENFSGVKLSNNKKIYLSFLGVIILYIISSYFAWYYRQYSLDALLSHLNKLLEFIAR